MVATRKGGGRLFRGGLPSYARVRDDLVTWVKQEQRNHDVAFSTMFDLYALPGDFPGMAGLRCTPMSRQRSWFS
jgi:hypothetical protein